MEDYRIVDNHGNILRFDSFIHCTSKERIEIEACSLIPISIRREEFV